MLSALYVEITLNVSSLLTDRTVLHFFFQTFFFSYIYFHAERTKKNLKKQSFVRLELNKINETILKR